MSESMTTGRSGGAGAPARRTGRGLMAVVLAGALVATGMVRSAVQARREVLDPRPAAVGSRLSGLDSFSLGLVLGGLRGPLVMILWTSSENQKSERNLEDIDTKIELIRLLQPEFDSVHIFQMWNKAYNLSVQMASVANKYATILDAIDYGRNVNEERPDNVNILIGIADIYYNKLGTSAEKDYYTQRVREDTLPAGKRAQKGDRGWRRTSHDVFLDENGFIRPGLLAPRPGAAGAPLGYLPGYNGAELQYLEKYTTPEAGGFPYGMPPQAIAYAYYQRSAALTNDPAVIQRHVQMSDTILDSRPGVALRGWGEEEWQRGRAREISALGLSVPEAKDKDAEKKLQLEVACEGVVPGARVVSGKDLADALFSYRRGAVVSADSVREYERHVKNARANARVEQYSSQIDNGRAMTAYLDGDWAYLSLVAQASGAKDVKWLVPGDASEIRARARASYASAIDGYYLMILKYYVEDAVVAAVYPMNPKTGKKFDKTTIQHLDPKQYPAVYEQVTKTIALTMRESMHKEDVGEYLTYIQKARLRLNHLSQ